MLGLDPIVVALIFIGLGISLAILVQLILRSSRKPGQSNEEQDVVDNVVRSESTKGVLIVGAGGRILSANKTLRDWLNLSESAQPNLEHIARRAHPSDAFLELCATPQTIRLSLQGMLVDASSYIIPDSGGNSTLISFQRVDITPLRKDTASDVSALSIISELGVLMTSNSDLSATIQAILESVERLIPTDIAEITIWQPEEYQLVPYRLVGPKGMERKLDMPSTRYRPGAGYTGRLFETLEPIVINLDDQKSKNSATGDHKTYPFKSYLGVPLVIGDTPIGTLELGSLTDIDYTEKDLETLLLLSNQAAVALNHALIRKEEAQRVTELTGLANLVQAVGAIQDPKDLFSHMVNSIRPLIDVEVLGFILFDNNARVLQAQSPFLGIPDHFIKLYKSTIEADTPGETIWLGQETILAPDAENDPKLEALGLAPLAQASGIRHTVLVPLSIAGTSVGYLQAANKRIEVPFTSDELRILTIVAGQSAVILENASLLLKSRQRTMEAEALRRISALAGSAVTLDEILLFTLNEIVRLSNADKAVIYLLNQDQGEMSVHAESAHGLSPEKLKPIAHFQVVDPLFARSNTAQNRVSVFNIFTPELESEDFYKPILKAMEIESLLSIPLTVSERSVGEIILGSNQTDVFHHGEVALVSTAAGQLAGAIERMLSASRTDENLRQRVDNLTTLNRIMRELNTTESIAEILDVIHREAINITGAECGSIFHLTQQGENYEIQNAAGEGDRNRYRLTSLELRGLKNRSPIVVREFDETNVRPPHGGVDAVLLVPLVTDNQVHGLLELHSFDPSAFGPDILEISDTFAFQAALALQNHIRFDLTHQKPELLGKTTPDEQHNISSSDRARAAIEIIRKVSQQTSRKAILDTLGIEMIEKMGFDLSFVATISLGKAVLTNIHGALPAEVNPDVLFGQQNPLRQSLSTGETLLYANLGSNGTGTWEDSPLLTQLEARSFICIPILTDNEENPVDAAILGLSTDKLPEFTTEDYKIFALMSRQIGTSLQNIDLTSKTLERLREVDLLLNFSRQLTSLNTEEILRSLLENTFSVIPDVQAAQILLWDQQVEHLVPYSVSGYRDDEAMAEIYWRPGEGLPGKVFAEGTGQRIEEVNIARDYHLPYEKLVRYQKATQGVVPIASLVVPLVSSSTILGVFVLESFSTPSAFKEEDEGLISSLAQQTGLILENARLLEEANDRAGQLEALTNVATTITSDLQVETITSSMLENLNKILPFDTGTFWLRRGDVLAIRATQGFEGDDDRVGLTVQIQDSKLLGDMVAESRPINVKNVTQDARFIVPEDFGQLSWLGIPLIAKGQVVGVIALEKEEEAFYTKEHTLVATTFAGQAAVALENARLFEESIQRAYELNERSQRLDLLNRLSNTFSTSLDTSHILSSTASEVRKAISCTAVSAVLFDEEGKGQLVAQAPTITQPIPQILDTSPFEQLHESLGSVFIDNVYTDTLVQPLETYWKEMGTQAAIVLSIAAGSELHGILILHSHSRLTSSEVDLARTISNQVAVAVQNAKLFDQSRQLTEDLEQRVQDRTQELEIEHQRTETLLGIITELSASLDMDIVLNRTLALINRITGAEHSTIILANPADTSLFRRASQGYTPPVPDGGQATDLDLNEGLAGWVIENREPALIGDLNKDSRWVSLGETEHRSSLAIPLMLGAEALGALMLFHRKANQFSSDHLDLINAAAKQIAVAVNNAQLYLLIRDQAERLGGMLRSQQIEASRLRAILEAVADGILVTDSRGQISLFNQSGEQILNLSQETVINRSLDYFTGLFGKASTQWMETIRAWSAQPYNFDAGQTFSEQIELENNHIVAVNLAPVYAAREFLGTVSIFRDITPLIEVDRMKSEFVATVSHELRTPMTSIKGYVDVLLMGAAGELNSQQQNFLDVVKNNTERLNILVNDLLEVSRIEAGKVNLNLVPLDLPSLANEVVSEFQKRSQEEEKVLQIQIVSPGRVPLANGDPDRIRQVLTNLVGNAYNYTPEGGKITVMFQEEPNRIRVAVKDTGIGIPPEEQKQVFERFFRGEATIASSVAGTGLGLSIVKYFVNLHGGEIWVESKGLPGDGSTFYFTLQKNLQEA